MTCETNGTLASLAVIGGARLLKNPLLSRSCFRLPAEQRFYVVKRAEPWSIVGHGSARSWNRHIYRKRNACDVVRTLGLSGASPHQVGSKPARTNQESWLTIGAPSFSPYHPITIRRAFTFHLSLLTNARAGDADPDNADANEQIPRADGRANAVHRADRSGHGHADDAHHANVDGRE